MDANFDRAFAFVVGEEGGYTSNPLDPGGETKFGISKRAYPDLDIKSLTEDDAKAIYLRDYWTPLGCENSAYGTAVCVFDCGVNMGIGRAKTFLLKVAPGPDFIVNYQAERGLFYGSLSTFPSFGRGWMRRLVRCALEASK